MTPRVQQSTEIEIFEHRMKVYNESLASFSAQIALAQSIQQAGQSIISQIERANVKYL